LVKDHHCKVIKQKLSFRNMLGLFERRMSSALHAAVLGRQLLEGLQSGSSAPPVAAALTADDVVLLDAGLILHRCNAHTILLLRG
jgi:hypothetical protein